MKIKMESFSIFKCVLSEKKEKKIIIEKQSFERGWDRKKKVLRIGAVTG
jgi:hypothetical protein